MQQLIPKSTIQRVLNIFLILFTGALFTWCSPGNSNQEDSREPSEHEADVIVYGGTSAAVTAAVQAAKMEKEVIIVSLAEHLGGLSL